MYVHCHFPSPAGQLTAASDGEHITGLWMVGQKYYASTLEPQSEEGDHPLFIDLKRWLSLYFDGKQPDLSLPLAPKGSVFRQSVWLKLRAVPFGQFTTYGDIAKQLQAESPDKRVSARAVGHAVGHNPLMILIPCHRVIGAGGNLTGYAGGIEKKIQLLQLEDIPIDKMTLPKPKPKR